MTGILGQIGAWAADLKYWERAALELVLRGKGITETDYQLLADHCLCDAGLVQMPATARPKLEFSRDPSSDHSLQYRLERLFNLRNVNALPAGQELRFGEHLTLIYGENGSGKTGYTRPLASAAFARGDRDVLPNATIPPAVPQADIEISTGGATSVITWSRGQRCAELAGVYVFDGLSLYAHLTQPNALSFSPSGLSVLKRLAEVTDQVRLRLRRLFDEKDVPHNFGPLFPGKSTVAAQMEMLDARTDVKVLEGLGTLAETDHARIQELDASVVQLKSQDVPGQIAAARRDAMDVRSLVSALQSSERLLGENAASEVRGLLDRLKNTKADAERLGAEQFNFGPFTQIGTEVWREFIDAARSLADAESKDGSYPIQSDRCLVCRQPLSQDAVNLIRNLWEFLSSDATRRFDAAQRSCDVKRQELLRGNFAYFSQDSGLRRTLSTIAPELAARVQEEVETLSARWSELVSSLTKGDLQELTPVAPTCEEALLGLAQKCDTRAKSLSDADNLGKIAKS